MKTRERNRLAIILVAILCCPIGCGENKQQPPESSPSKPDASAKSAAQDITGGGEKNADTNPSQAVHTPGILWIDGESPDMVAAIKTAQQTFGKYETELQRESKRVVPALDDAAVKVFFPSPDDPKSGEHMWVNEISLDADRMQGTLQNDANAISDLTAGDRVNFTRDRVSDWYFVVDGVAEGGYTIKLMLKQMPRDQFELYRDAPPVCYFVEWYLELRQD